MWRRCSPGENKNGGNGRDPRDVIPDALFVSSVILFFDTCTKHRQKEEDVYDGRLFPALPDVVVFLCHRNGTRGGGGRRRDRRFFFKKEKFSFYSFVVLNNNDTSASKLSGYTFVLEMSTGNGPDLRK